VEDWNRVTNTIGLSSTVADFLPAKGVLDRKRPFCVFEPPLGGLEATYADHLRLIEKRVVDFLLVLTELFSLGVTAEAL